MAYVLDPGEAVRREVPRVATERLEDAIEHGDGPETFRKQSLAITAAHSQLRRGFQPQEPN